MQENLVHARLQVGMPAPTFVACGVRGEPVASADLWPAGPTLLTFLRHFG